LSASIGAATVRGILKMADLSAWLDKNKALWSRVYDEVIAPDFEQEWKKRACMSPLKPGTSR
jgi:hypothetical protein